MSPKFLQLGFTATPTGRERILSRTRELDLMRSGVLPRTYVVRVEGEDLSALKVSQRSTDVSTKQLVSVLLDMPSRNRRIYNALAQRGLLNRDLAPSGGVNFRATLGFAADTQHAAMMAKQYVTHFAEPRIDNPRYGRTLQLLGEHAGRMNAHELDSAFAAYDAGASDGIVAMVSGNTPRTIRDKILQAVIDGKVEIVFNVDVWYEGADLWMFTHLLGSRPTFSRIKKGQERGRPNRRGPNEVSPDGVILADPPKILFDVIDRYHSHDHHLYTYTDVIDGTGIVQAPFNALYDVIGETTVDSIDQHGRVGSTMLHVVPRTKTRPRRPKPEWLRLHATDWAPMAETLWDIFEQQYDANLTTMAADLAITEDDLSALLRGEGWANHRWFLRRLATLLYADRNLLVQQYNDQRTQYDTVHEADTTILQGALAVFEQYEGDTSALQVLVYGAGYNTWGPASQKSLKQLADNTLHLQQWRRLWHGAFTYFAAPKDTDTHEQQREKQSWAERLWKHLFARQQWETTAETPTDRLLLHARDHLARRFGGALPERSGIAELGKQGEKSALQQWLRGEQPSTLRKLYGSQIRALLIYCGADPQVVDQLIEAAVFTTQEWSTEARTPSEYLHLRAQQVIAARYGGQLPVDHDIAELPRQGTKAILRRWLYTGEIAPRKKSSTSNIYAQIRTLLVDSGVPDSEADALIEAAIFGKNQWETEASSARERLRLRARRGVAYTFGERLPQAHGITGIPEQATDATLFRWLQGEALSTDHSTALYPQIRKLLLHGGETAESADTLIENAIFAQRGWSVGGANSIDTLRNYARQRIAHTYGGQIPQSARISGLPKVGVNSPIRRWIEDAEQGATLLGKWPGLYSQIRTLLHHCGGDQAQVDTLITSAIFEERGWSHDTSTPGARLRDRARQLVAQHHNGRLPAKHGIPNLPLQPSTALAARWLDGHVSTRGKADVAVNLFSHIRALLLGCGEAPGKAQKLMEEAIFADLDWNIETATPAQQLRHRARQVVAQQYDGTIPTAYRRGRLGQWLNGQRDDFPIELRRQIRTFLTEGQVPTEEVDQLLLKTIFAHNKWPTEATSPSEQLLLRCRQLLVTRFDGALPNETEITGLPTKLHSTSLFRQWISGRRTTASRRTRGDDLYKQVRAFLQACNLPAEQINQNLENVIFAELQWNRANATAHDTLRLEARRAVIARFHGRLPNEHDVPGIPVQGSNAPLRRWLDANTAQPPTTKSGQSLLPQIRALLIACGVSEQKVTQLINATQPEIDTNAH